MQGEHLDVIVSEIALGYENYLHEKAENDAKGIPTMGKKHTQKDLANMMKEVNNERKENEGHDDT